MNSSLLAPRHSRLFEELLQKSWWVILFFLICLFAYDHAMKKRHQEETQLKKKLEDIRYEKSIAMEKQEELKLQIASQTDPAWIEMTLMKGLGLVPEGQKKVLFVPMKESTLQP